MIIDSEDDRTLLLQALDGVEIRVPGVRLAATAEVHARLKDAVTHAGVMAPARAAPEATRPVQPSVAPAPPPRGKLGKKDT